MKSIFSLAIICAFAVSTVCVSGCSEPATTPEGSKENMEEHAETMDEKAEGMEDHAMDMKEDAKDMKEAAHGSDHK